MSVNCGACKVAVHNGVNGHVYNPLGIVSAFCNTCIRKYDTVRYGCSHCKNLFDPSEEGVVGDNGVQYCGNCCCEHDVDENLTLADMSDKIANGATFMEA